MSRSTMGLPAHVQEYLLRLGVRESAALAELRKKTSELEWARMQISPEQGAFMALMVKLIGAKRCLEVGTFTGYSTIAVAEALPDDGRIVAMDVSEEWTAMGVDAWTKAGFASKVDLRIAPAADTLQSLIDAGESGSYDFAFIDADKTSYDTYYERCLTLVRPGGLVAVDNVLWNGAVAEDAEPDEDTVALRKLNEKLHVDERIDAMMCPISDGLYLVRKR